jgi:hypothetical protein
MQIYAKIKKEDASLAAGGEGMVVPQNSISIPSKDAGQPIIQTERSSTAANSEINSTKNSISSEAEAAVSIPNASISQGNVSEVLESDNGIKIMEFTEEEPPHLRMPLFNKIEDLFQTNNFLQTFSLSQISSSSW